MIGYFGFDPNDCLIGEMSTTINLNIKNYKKEDVSSIMLSWIPTKTGTSQKKASALLSQTELIEKYVKKVPIVIFDRYSSMTSDEYQYLRKYNVKFFEPVIMCRNGFEYLPHWTKIKTIDEIQLNDSKRSVNLGYIGDMSDKTKQFERYYVTPLELLRSCGVDAKVSYKTKSISSDMEQLYKNVNIMNNQDLTFDDIEFTVIIGSIHQYAVGYLDQYFIEALDHNCIPVMPKENRYFSAFVNGVDSDTWYCEYFNMYDKIYVGMIKDMYDSIKRYYPEMDIKCTADTIKFHLSEK